MGHLEIKGNINLGQFWPEGKSDADTTKLQLKVNEDSFIFHASSDSKPKKTKVFLESIVKPVSGSSVRPVKYQGTARQYITIRLEGIDAPELHYKFYDPSNLAKYRDNPLFKKYNVEYRQFYSEIATEALSNKLKQYKNKEMLVPCVFKTNNISKPSDACDIYGRFVGYIYVDNDKLNVNEWLLQQGFVFPAFYDSAEEAELIKLKKAFVTGKTVPATTLANYSPKLLPFDYQLRFRPHGPSNPAGDSGKLILPKLYRRQCYFAILTKAGIFPDNFTDYLKSKMDDKLILYTDLKAYRQSKNKSGFRGIQHLTDIYQLNGLTLEPDEFVFIEKGSVLIDPVTRKEKITF